MGSSKHILENISGKMAGQSHYISIVTLNINGLNSSVKRHRLTGSKNTTQLFVAYKKHISLTKRHAD